MSCDIADPSNDIVDVLIQCMDWNIATRQSRIPEADLPELHNKAVALLDQASHLAVPTLLLWTDDGAAISTKSTRGCGCLGAASPALGACPSSRLGRGSKSQAMHGTSGQPRQNGLARRLEPDSK